MGRDRQSAARFTALTDIQELEAAMHPHPASRPALPEEAIEEDLGLRLGIRDWHANGNGRSDVGYHYFLKKHSEWQGGRPLERTSAAQGDGFNTGTAWLLRDQFSEGKKAGAAAVTTTVQQETIKA